MNGHVQQLRMVFITIFPKKIAEDSGEVVVHFGHRRALVPQVIVLFVAVFLHWHLSNAS